MNLDTEGQKMSPEELADKNETAPHWDELRDQMADDVTEESAPVVTANPEVIAGLKNEAAEAADNSDLDASVDAAPERVAAPQPKKPGFMESIRRLFGG